MRTAYLHIEPPQQVGDSFRHSAILELPDASGQELWFECPAEIRGDCPAPEAFALACLFEAMSGADALAIDNAIPESMARNLAEISQIWACWKPDHYKPLEIVSDTRPDSLPPQSAGWLSAMSGGVDGTCTLLRHATTGLGVRRRPVVASVFIHGFDVSLDNSAAKQEAFRRAEAICSRLSTPLYCVRTNIKSGPLWEDSFAAKVGAVLMLGTGRFAGGMLASDEPYATPIFPWGSNPISNPYVGATEFPIFTDAQELGRLERVRALSSHPHVLEQLRVCWEGKDQGRNCGECEKCIRTMLELAAVGVKDCAAFDRPLQPGAVKRISARNPTQLTLLQEVHDHCRRSGIREWWVRELGVVCNRGVVRRRRTLGSLAMAACKRVLPRGACSESGI